MEHVHKTYSCDRCQKEIGSERPKRSQGAIVTATFNWADGPGPSYDWKDLCDPCYGFVKAFFLRPLQESHAPPAGYDRPTKEEKESARAWAIGLLDMPNTDIGEHMLVRAMRLMGDSKL